MMKFMNRIIPACQEVSRLSSQAMDESLPWRKRLALKLHLSMCRWCRRNSEQMRLMRTMASRPAAATDESTPPDMATSTRVRLMPRRLPERREAGRLMITFDGRNDMGKPLPSGLYLARLETETGAAESRLVLLK